MNSSEMTLCIGPPLDYSFQDIHCMKDVPDREPLGGNSKAQSIEKDSLNDANSKIAVDVTSKKLALINSQDDDAKLRLEMKTKAIKLSYNHLKGLEGFGTAVNSILSEAPNLHWIDLSHNHLESIDPVLLNYPQLRVLYLHGNHITKLKEVHKLRKLGGLMKLTLHGNPIEEKHCYRKCVIETLPNLLSLDFIRITPRDRDLAKVWANSRCKLSNK